MHVLCEEFVNFLKFKKRLRLKLNVNVHKLFMPEKCEADILTENVTQGRDVMR